MLPRRRQEVAASEKIGKNKDLIYSGVMSPRPEPLPSAAAPKNLGTLIDESIAQSHALLGRNAPSNDAPMLATDNVLLDRALKLISDANQQLLAQRLKINTLENLVTHDPLTGLLNRRGLEDQLSRELSRVKRGESRGCTLVLYDLDGFKAINDNYGHPAGDAAICKVGEFFGHTIRATDATARLGGDEFAVVLTNIDPTQGELRARILADALNGLSFPWEGNTIALKTSFGAAQSAMPEDKFERLYRAADQALYRAKLHRSHRS